MGLSRSLSAGASSLKAHQQRFDVISNNLANTNTIGYKSSRMTFVDQFSQTYFLGQQPESTNELGGANPCQYGLGVKVGSITADMSQGVLASTSRPLDLALQGDGFFVYSQNGHQLYSRAGAIAQDKEGYLVDSSTAAFLQGYNVLTDSNGVPVKDANGNNILNTKLEGIQIKSTTVSPPSQTKNINVTGNISADMTATDTRQTSINIYDKLGAVHTLNLTFSPIFSGTPPVKDANNMNVSATLDGAALTLSSATIQFNPNGTPVTTSLGITQANLETAIPNAFSSDINISLASSTSGITKYSGTSTASIVDQDGYQSGDLIGLSVDEKGKVWGSFTNGRSETLGQVSVAKFANPQGLVKEGNNLFSAGPNSGDAHIGTAGDIFPSTAIASGALEQSNVDMTTQFTDMIETQRAFEAASRTITISDQMLAEVNMLKR